MLIVKGGRAHSFHHGPLARQAGGGTEPAEVLPNGKGAGSQDNGLFLPPERGLEPVSYTHLVSHAVATLRDGGFLTMDSDYFLHLTDVGREVAEQIYEKHRFFTECLIAAGVDPKTAEADACRIEHVISDESFQKLKKQLM